MIRQKIRKSGFTLVELSISVLIISSIIMVLLMILRSNLNTFKWGQAHVSFEQKKLLAARQIFYDIKSINPILSSDRMGVKLKGESMEEFGVNLVTIDKKNENFNTLRFIQASFEDLEKRDVVYYFVKENNLYREITDKNGKGSGKVILENVVSLVFDEDSNDHKQIHVKFMVGDPKNNLKPEPVDFVIRLETDLVHVKTIN